MHFIKGICWIVTFFFILRITHVKMCIDELLCLTCDSAMSIKETMSITVLVFQMISNQNYYCTIISSNLHHLCEFKWTNKVATPQVECVNRWMNGIFVPELNETFGVTCVFGWLRSSSSIWNYAASKHCNTLI